MSGTPAAAVYATRYALGRMSTAPHDVRDFIAENLAEISGDPGCRKAILDDIDDAENNGRLGMPCDAQAWREVAEMLRGAAARVVVPPHDSEQT